MSNPPGPTGIITLKKIGDLTYEQYGKIQMSATGLTQIVISTDSFTTWFEQRNIEQTVTWIEDFASRVQHDEIVKAGGAAWQGGSWSTQGGIDDALAATPSLDGAVRLRLTTLSTALPAANFEASNGPFDGQQGTSHVNRNPTFYQRWAQTATSSVGMMAIGWHRGGESFTNLDLATGSSGLVSGIYVRHTNGSDIVACCRTFVGPTRLETTMSTGVVAAPGVYHTARMVVTGGGAAVEFFIDGVSKGTITTNIPAESGASFQLSPGFASSVANDETLSVDYMALSQQRSP